MLISNSSEEEGGTKSDPAGQAGPGVAQRRASRDNFISPP